MGSVDFILFTEPPLDPGKRMEMYLHYTVEERSASGRTNR